MTDEGPDVWIDPVIWRPEQFINADVYVDSWSFLDHSQLALIRYEPEGTPMTVKPTPHDIPDLPLPECEIPPYVSNPDEKLVWPALPDNATTEEVAAARDAIALDVDDTFAKAKARKEYLASEIDRLNAAILEIRASAAGRMGSLRAQIGLHRVEISTLERIIRAEHPVKRPRPKKAG